jgi:predicted FMN-binding regulatory protein PaiB
LGAHPGLRHWASGPGAAGADRISGRGKSHPEGPVERAAEALGRRGIVGFRFPVTRLEGKWKMSQNRDVQDRDGVAKGLGQRGDGDDLEAAEIVSGQIVPGS